MAPKREIQFLGSTQPAGDCWRAEVPSVGKGPSRPTRTEAQGDLDIARQANSRQDMGALLRQMTTEAFAAQSLTGQRIEPKPVLLLQQHSHAHTAKTLIGKTRQTFYAFGSVLALAFSGVQCLLLSTMRKTQAVLSFRTAIEPTLSALKLDMQAVGVVRRSGVSCSTEDGVAYIRPVMMDHSVLHTTSTSTPILEDAEFAHRAYDLPPT